MENNIGPTKYAVTLKNFLIFCTKTIRVHSIATLFCITQCKKSVGKIYKESSRKRAPIKIP